MMKRQNLRTGKLAILSIIWAAVSACSSGTQNQERTPNVIIIYTDDQGSIDVNAYGAKDLYTPNMDYLAETGVMFTQFYAAAPVCSPSRAALLTGKTPLAAGLPGKASSQPGWGGMPSEQHTIAEILKDNGFVTGHVGKWHLGYTPETMPNGQGFDYSFGHMGGCIDNYSHFFYWAGPNRHDLWENNKEIWMDGEYFQDLMAEKVDSFLEEHRDTTFFLYYAINLPHLKERA
jgi:arylsulfatase A